MIRATLQAFGRPEQALEVQRHKAIRRGRKTSVWKCQVRFAIDQVLRFRQEVGARLLRKADGGGGWGGGLEELAAWRAAVTFNT